MVEDLLNMDLEKAHASVSRSVRRSGQAERSTSSLGFEVDHLGLSRHI